MQPNVPSFTDVELIGAGGMGTVYRAFDPSMNRVVALKVMSVPLGAPEQLKRFMREAHALSRLEHTNIIKVYRVGQNDAMQPYMVLEYVDGQSLDLIIEREGALAVDRALPLFKQLASALACAHAQGIVHRDVKPSNVLLAGNIAKLADFGIARDLMRTTQATQPGTMIGSPMYASPEQSAGQPVDARSDVYSLGCLMYEVLTGQRPFHGENLLAVVLAHQTQQVQPIKDLPEGIDRIVRRCLMKNASDRFANGSELLKALESGDAVLPAFEDRMKSVTPRRFPIGAVMGVAVLLTVSLVIFLALHGVRSQRAMENVNFDDAKTHFEDAKKMNRPEDKEAATELYARADREFSHLATTENEFRRPLIYNELGQLRLMQGDWQGAAESFRLAIKLQQALHQQIPWRYHSGLATALIELHEPIEAEQQLVYAVAGNGREEDVGFRFFSDYFIGVGEEYQGHYQQALDWYVKAQADYSPSAWAGPDILEKATVRAQALLKTHPKLHRKSTPQQ
jgi:serine/threonine protein kinase